MTPAGKFGEADPLGQRRLHDAETMMGESNLKVDRLTSKLTGSHQEVQRLRTQLEAREKDLIYQTRLAERVKKEQAHVQADADAHREVAKRLEARLSNARLLVAPGGGDHSTAALAERVQRLTARLQGEQETVRAQKRETARLQGECEVMREALEARGEMGALQRAVVQARADSLRLALQLHDAKEAASSAHEAGARADEQAAEQRAAAEGLRALLGELSENADNLQAELSRERAASARLQAAGRKLQAQLQAQTDAAAAAARHEAEAGEALGTLRATSAELGLEIATLRGEMSQREEEFQVELHLFAERHDELAGAARRAEAEARAEKARGEALQQGLQGTRARESELMNEVANLNASLDALTEQNGSLQRDYGELAQRHRQQGGELSKTAASLEVSQETADARHAMLAARLEASLRELQAVLGERDALKSSLDEALRRCASSMVSAQLAESSQAHMQEQLTTLRQHQHLESLSPVRSPLRAPPASTRSEL